MLSDKQTLKIVNKYLNPVDFSRENLFTTYSCFDNKYIIHTKYL